VLHVNAFLKIGTILCWALAIGIEYVAQKWPSRGRLLNAVAMVAFALALCGEYGSYRYEEFPETQWFQATDANSEAFVLSYTPLPGTEEVLINGLIEHGNDVYTVHGNTVTIWTPLSRSDQIMIKYRHRR
jgi:hypothetical protein